MKGSIMFLREILVERPLDSKYDFAPDLVNDTYAKALYWVSRNVDLDDLKKAALEWLDSNGFDRDDFINEKPFKLKGIGASAYLANRGRQLEQSTIDWMKKKAEEIKNSAPVNFNLNDEPENNDEELSAKDRSREAYLSVRAELDNKRSDGKALGGYLDYDQIVEVLKKVGGSKKIIKTLTREYEELLADESEGDFKDHIKDILTALKKFGAKVKTQDLVRKKSTLAKKAAKGTLTRKDKKTIKASKDSTPYKKESDKFDIKSKKPAALEGAKAALTYNEKTGVLSLYVADTDKGLGIKGPRITGFGKKSVAKKLRKPESNLEKVQSGGLPRIQKLMNESKAKGNMPRPKLSEDTLILKVY